MKELAKMKRFYLTDHDFNILVNKGCQTYHKTLDEELSNKTVQEIYKEMQKGGCNEPRQQQ